MTPTLWRVTGMSFHIGSDATSSALSANSVLLAEAFDDLADVDDAGLALETLMAGVEPFAWYSNHPRLWKHSLFSTRTDVGVSRSPFSIHTFHCTHLPLILPRTPLCLFHPPSLSLSLNLSLFSCPFLSTLQRLHIAATPSNTITAVLNPPPPLRPRTTPAGLSPAAFRRSRRSRS